MSTSAKSTLLVKSSRKIYVWDTDVLCRVLRTIRMKQRLVETMVEERRREEEGVSKIRCWHWCEGPGRSEKVHRQSRRHKRQTLRTYVEEGVWERGTCRWEDRGSGLVSVEDENFWKRPTQDGHVSFIEERKGKTRSSYKGSRVSATTRMNDLEFRRRGGIRS